MKISRDLEWLLPFIKAASGLVDLNNIKVVKSFKNRNPSTDGVTHYFRKNSMMITIRSHYWNKKTQSYKPLWKAQVLDTLAHELAHSKTGHQHDITHFDMQTRILRAFVPVVRKTGVELWSNQKRKT